MVSKGGGQELGAGGAECPEGLGGFPGGMEGLGTQADVGHRGSLGHVQGYGLYTKSDRESLKACTGGQHDNACFLRRLFWLLFGEWVLGRTRWNPGAIKQVTAAVRRQWSRGVD